MNIEDLRDYNNWIGKSPEVIRQHVIKNNGWVNVFPSGQKFPIWASRIRNFFNERPTRFKRLHPTLASFEATRIIKHGSTLSRLTLSRRDVYIDETGRKWFEMKTAGAGFHFEDRNWIERQGKYIKAAKGFVTPQSQIPVFKLISPDDTGGSLELCIHNYQRFNSVLQALNPFTRGTGGKSTIAPIDKWVNIKPNVVVNEVYRGSYNYSEVVVSGNEAHDFRDVKPHKTTNGFYINPPRGSTAKNRIFPRNDWNGRLISFTPQTLCK